MLEFVLRLDLEIILMEKQFFLNKIGGLKNLYFVLSIKERKGIFMVLWLTCVVSQDLKNMDEQGILAVIIST